MKKLFGSFLALGLLFFVQNNVSGAERRPRARLASQDPEQIFPPLDGREAGATLQRYQQSSTFPGGPLSMKLKLAEFPSGQKVARALIMQQGAERVVLSEKFPPEEVAVYVKQSGFSGVPVFVGSYLDVGQLMLLVNSKHGLSKGARRYLAELGACYGNRDADPSAIKVPTKLHHKYCLFDKSDRLKPHVAALIKLGGTLALQEGDKNPRLTHLEFGPVCGFYRSHHQLGSPSSPLSVHVTMPVKEN